MKYTEIEQKTAAETIAYIGRTAKAATKGKLQKSLAMAIYHLLHCNEEGNEFQGEAGLKSLASFAKKKWEVDLRNGPGVQGTYECLRVFTGIHEGEFESSEAKFMISPLACNLMLSSALNDATMTKHLPGFIEAYNMGRGAFKAMKDLKASTKATKPKVTPKGAETTDPPAASKPEPSGAPEKPAVETVEKPAATLPLPEACQSIYEEIARAASAGDVDRLNQIGAFFMECATACEAKAGEIKKAA